MLETGSGYGRMEQSCELPSQFKNMGNSSSSCPNLAFSNQTVSACMLHTIQKCSEEGLRTAETTVALFGQKQKRVTKM